MKKQIGIVGVDSGSILISDPCYINDCFSIQGDDIFKIYPEKERHFQINTKATNNTVKIPVAVTLRTGYGDGAYPVMATYNKDGVIKKIEISFE